MKLVRKCFDQIRRTKSDESKLLKVNLQIDRALHNKDLWLSLSDYPQALKVLRAEQSLNEAYRCISRQKLADALAILIQLNEVTQENLKYQSLTKQTRQFALLLCQLLNYSTEELRCSLDKIAPSAVYDYLHSVMMDEINSKQRHEESEKYE